MIGKIFNEENRITTFEALKNCIYGGRGQIDLVAPSGKSHCYRFELPKDDDFPQGIRFVYAIHENRKFYIGMVEDEKFRLTKHSHFDKDTEIVQGAYYIMKVYSEATTIPVYKVKMRMYHNGRCAKCGKVLANIKFKKFGMGNKCLAKFREMELKDIVGHNTSTV